MHAYTKTPIAIAISVAIKTFLSPHLIEPYHSNSLLFINPKQAPRLTHPSRKSPSILFQFLTPHLPLLPHLHLQSHSPPLLTHLHLHPHSPPLHLPSAFFPPTNHNHLTPRLLSLARLGLVLLRSSSSSTSLNRVG